MDVEMEGHRYQKNPQDIKDVQRLEKKDKEGRTLRSLQFDVPNAISTICWYGLRYAGVFFPTASPQHFAAGCLCSGRKHGISTV